MAIKGAVKFTFPREKRVIPFEHGTTFDGGDLIVLHHQDLLPGDNVKIKLNYVLRALTPLNPVMDNAFLSIDVYACPVRLLWTDFFGFMGQNDTTYWTETGSYTVPTTNWLPSLISDLDGAHFIGGYFGLPLQPLSAEPQDGWTVTILPLRAYALTYNFWYRDQNVTPPVLFTKGSTSYNQIHPATNDKTLYDHFSYMTVPLKSEKLPDYFTMLLPQPQKGAEQTANGMVVPGNTHSLPGLDMIWSLKSGSYIGNGEKAILAASGISKAVDIGSVFEEEDRTASAVPSNLWANVGISALRDAIFRQHILEIRGKSGTRYASETLPSLFGVQNSEALLSEAQYLGGIDKLINMTEVLSNSDTTASGGRPLGANGAMSKTTGSDYLCNYSASEHCILLVLATVRHRETYFQGIERRWNRLSFWDWYLPQAAGLGMQPVYKRELNCEGLTDADRTIFGYRDYGADYTFFPNRLSGRMSPLLGSNGLSSWTYGSVLSANPVLNSDFMKADNTGFARTMVVQPTYAGMQFFGDFKFDIELTSVIRSQRFPGMDRI